MKKIIAILCWLLPLNIHAQNAEGIRFSTAKNWAEVLIEAKIQNKPIFVDAYASWCGPCKMMDRDVFSDQQVADFVNTNFIAVKVQMDSTNNDNAYLKGWYTDAANWKLYVTAFPAFLFYSSAGEYSGKEEGYYKPVDFITMLKKVLDPKGSYLAQIKAYQEGKLDKVQTLKLAFWAKDNNDSIAFKIAKAYKIKYIDPVSVDSLLNPEADRFHSTFIDLFTFRDGIIKYMYKYPSKTDAKFSRWADYSKGLTDYIISRDYIYKVILPHDLPTTRTPNWEKLNDGISKAFDSKIAQRLILDSKIYWAFRFKDWSQASSLTFKKIDSYGMDTTGMERLKLNNMIYEVVFKHINSPKLLSKAVSLMKRIMELDNYRSDERLDTYASILYKSGKRKLAIAMETKALGIASQKKNEANARLYRDTIDKMNNGTEIWKTQ